MVAVIFLHQQSNKLSLLQFTQKKKPSLKYGSKILASPGEGNLEITHVGLFFRMPSDRLFLRIS